MSAERKKAEKKEAPKVEPKKRAEPKPVPKVEPKKRVEVKAEVKPKEVAPKTKAKAEVKPKEVTSKPVAVKPVVKEVEKKVSTPFITEATDAKPKRSENKYVRIALDAKPEEKKEFSEKVQKGELKLACYAIDGDKGYHYYLVIKK